MQYYEKASNTEKLVQCYYKLEDYSSLENLIDVLQPNDPLLVILGKESTLKINYDCRFLAKKIFERPRKAILT